MSDSANLILPRHQDHRNVYYFDRHSGRYTKGFDRDMSLRHVDGLGFEYKCGLWKRRRVFCSMFVADLTLWLRLGDVEIDMCDPMASLVKGSPAPFVRTFEARKHGAVIVACRYWEQVFLQDPEEDLLAWACDIARDPATLEETRQRWLQHFSRKAQ